MKASLKPKYLTISLYLISIVITPFIDPWLPFLLGFVIIVWIIYCDLYPMAFLKIKCQDTGLHHETQTCKTFIPWNAIVEISTKGFLNPGYEIIAEPKFYSVCINKNFPKAKEIISKIEQKMNECKIIYIDD